MIYFSEFPQEALDVIRTANERLSALQKENERLVRLVRERFDEGLSSCVHDEWMEKAAHILGEEGWR